MSTAQRTADEALLVARQAAGLGLPTVINRVPAVSGKQLGFLIEAEVVNAGSVTLDTGYKPGVGHGAGIDGGVVIVDEATGNTAKRNTAGACHTPVGGGNAVADGFTAPTAVGNATVSGSTIAMSISAGGTVQFTFTNPALFVGTLRWAYFPTFSED